MNHLRFLACPIALLCLYFVSPKTGVGQDKIEAAPSPEIKPDKQLKGGLDQPRLLAGCRQECRG